VKLINVLIGIVAFGCILCLGKMLVNDSSDNQSTHLRKWDGTEDPYSSAENYYRYKQYKSKMGIHKLEMPEEHARMAREIRTPIDRTSPEYGDNHIMAEYNKAQAAIKKLQLKSSDLNFIERGPGNIAGRTRALLVLPSDPSNETWLAGSASGGIWKTRDAGNSWENMTEDFPNLGTNTLAMSESDPNIIYAGTGEHFVADTDGSGIFKSEDEGETWRQIVAPGDFDALRTISRMAVDPDDPNTVVVTSRNSVWEDSLRAAIYMTNDGGVTWDLKLLSTEDRYDDIAVNPLNFSTMYVAARRKGVLKSTDGGNTWVERNMNMSIDGRLEIDVSSVDTNYVWGLAEGSLSGVGTDVYISRDGAETWNLAAVPDDAEDYLNGQGFYDNVIEAHPFRREIAYVGGVDLFKITLRPIESTSTILNLEDGGAFQFLDFVNGRNISAGGGIFPGELPRSDFPSIEIRFGQGSQLAHRFTVNMQGAGVRGAGYIYQDLVEVPFQIWDIDNNVQLMASIRDQAEDGEWTLNEENLNANDPGNDTREYIFPHLIPYEPFESPGIARDGGHEELQLYLIWPILVDGQTYDFENGDPVSFRMLTDFLTITNLRESNISDARGMFQGVNGFSNAQFEANQGLHPDHHSLTFVIGDTSTRTFSMISTNDGGVYQSRVSSNPGEADGDFRYAGFGYNTTQFYGADKMPGEDRYIGGMQDNSTWFTRAGETASAESFYNFAVGGDGFEALWNNRDPNQLLGSIQFNNIQRSDDGGQTWRRSTDGLTDTGNGRAPFFSRLANAKSKPDQVFAVGPSGVWKSLNFGRSWELTPITGQWSFTSRMDVEVSEANTNVVWAGGMMTPSRRIFVSDNGGESFSPTSVYPNEELGIVSGLGSHPIEAETGYALFSFARRPKVLRTRDLGQTWEDISGFETGGDVSDRGFPDVALNSILVFPNDPNRIWVGSDIGIIESLDDGASWNLLECNLPSVPVSQMRIQDDQIVIATYGRGIWSVQVEGIERVNVFAPVVTGVTTSPEGARTLVTSIIGSEFDSITFLADGQRIGEPVFNVELGEGIILPLVDFDLPDGVYELQSVGHLNGDEFISDPFTAFLFVARAPVIEYFNEFSNAEQVEDFIGTGFSERIEFGFNNNTAIQGRHNYENNSNEVYQLKTPIMVQDSQTFRYQDVAIVETGEAGSSFGDDNFFDFVVPEGSIDGVEWIPLTEGYDASFDPTWLSTFNSRSNGTADMYVLHEIDLTENFDIGDVIFIRFRLFTDQGLTAWGWAIDDVEVRLEMSTPVFDPTFEEINIYPNPASEQLLIELPSQTRVTEVSIFDLQGRRILVQDAILSDNAFRLDVSRFSPGLYLLELREDRELVVSERIVIME